MKWLVALEKVKEKDQKEKTLPLSLKQSNPASSGIFYLIKIRVVNFNWNCMVTLNWN